MHAHQVHESQGEHQTEAGLRMDGKLGSTRSRIKNIFQKYLKNNNISFEILSHLLV